MIVGKVWVVHSGTGSQCMAHKKMSFPKLCWEQKSREDPWHKGRLENMFQEKNKALTKQRHQTWPQLKCEHKLWG